MSNTNTSIVPAEGIPNNNNNNNNNPAPAPIIYKPDPEWQAKLFDCCLEPKIACLAFTCPGAVQGLNIYNVTDGNFSCCVQGTAKCFVYASGLYFYSGCLQRQKNRIYLQIAGNAENDCIIHCFCAPCALVQEYREIEIRKKQGYAYLNAPGHVRHECFECECKRCLAPPPVGNIMK
jgi:Cys-rich protein (TIGR01571 family)